VLLRAEIFAFLVILANAFSGLRIGPHQKGDKLSKVFDLDPELAFPKRVIVGEGGPPYTTMLSN